MEYSELRNKYGRLDRKGKWPFDIHGDIAMKGGYPTHTHGLSKLGMPEFIIHACCFGPRGNARLINGMFIYVIKNRPAYMKLMRGERIEVQPWGPDNDTTVCIRRVERDFEAVKFAYDGYNLKGVKLAQIYIKGDEHALTDAYYLLQKEIAKEGESVMVGICEECRKGGVGHA